MSGDRQHQVVVLADERAAREARRVLYAIGLRRASARNDNRGRMANPDGSAPAHVPDPGSRQAPAPAPAQAGQAPPPIFGRWGTVIALSGVVITFVSFIYNVGRTSQRIDDQEKKLDEIRSDIRDVMSVKLKAGAGGSYAVDAGVATDSQATVDAASSRFTGIMVCRPGTVRVFRGDIDAGGPVCLDAAKALRREFGNEYLFRKTLGELKTGYDLTWTAQVTPPIECTCTMQQAP